jgi:hypothetical protein
VLALLFVDYAISRGHRAIIQIPPYKQLVHLAEAFDSPSSNFGEDVVFDVITSSAWGSLP